MKKLALINPVKFEESMSKKNEVVSLQYIKSFLSKYGYSADIYDFQILLECEIKEIIKYIAKHYNIVGISCYFPYNPLELAQYLKSYNDRIFIFCGGPMASLIYKKLLYEESPIDLISINEGEWTILEIMKKYCGNYPLKYIEGTAYRYNGNIKYKGRKFEKNLDLFPFPHREKNYFKQYIPTIVSSRGCNGRCKFCSTRYTGYWRGRSPENVYLEIQHLVIEQKQNYFQFIEPNFLEDAERAERIAKLIKELPQKVYFDFAARIDSIYKNNIAVRALKNAGAVKVLLGVENFSDDILKEWMKDITCQEIEMAIEVLNESKLTFTVSFILFHPKTTKKELLFNIKKIEELNIIRKIEKLYNRLILIPGTKLNQGEELKEWKFEKSEIKDIYGKCISFQKKCRLFIGNLENYIIKNENSSYFLAKALDLCMNRKLYEFEYLKSLLLDREYETPKVSLKNKKICINSQIVIEETFLEKNKLFINSYTGLIYEISENLYSFIKNIDNTNVNNFISEILKYYIKQPDDAMLLLKYVISLIEQNILVI